MRTEFLESILSQPTAPFREGRVISKIKQKLETESVPHFQDPIGNIVIGVRNKAEYLRLIKNPSREPVRLFIAHMDHPGFHGIRWKSETELEVLWHGGSPTRELEGASVWLADSAGWQGKGKMRNATLIDSGRAIQQASVHFEEKVSIPAKKIYGGFSFRSPWWKDGDLIYTKAADDLVGSFAIASTAIDLFTKKRKFSPTQNFLGLLTRAEEVGFIGAIGHFNLGWLKQARRSVLCVSLETSRALPGAEIGKGPVVRLGDKFTVFDAGAIRVFSDLAQEVLPDQHQRKTMDGGTCEASAATVFGYPSIGISVPLGNYHNQSLEGGPDAAASSGPAPEFVDRKDIEGLLTLCKALLQKGLPWSNPWKNKKVEFKKSLEKYGKLLRSGT